MATRPKADPDRADEAPAPKAAPPYFLGGVWYAHTGRPLTDAEAQQAHRAQDAAALEARARALRGEE